MGQNGWFKVEDKLNDLLAKTIDFIQEILIAVLDAKFRVKYKYVSIIKNV